MWVAVLDNEHLGNAVQSVWHHEAADGLEQPAVVEPVDAVQHCELHRIYVPPRARYKVSGTTKQRTVGVDVKSTWALLSLPSRSDEVWRTLVRRTWTLVVGRRRFVR